MISDFDSGTLAATFGFPWYRTSDARMGGNSTAKIEVVKGGAGGTSHALHISGTIGTDARFAWGGAVFFPGPKRMTPADLSPTEEISFYARSANKATYRVIISLKVAEGLLHKNLLSEPSGKSTVLSGLILGWTVLLCAWYLS